MLLVRSVNKGLHFVSLAEVIQAVPWHTLFFRYVWLTELIIIVAYTQLFIFKENKTNNTIGVEQDLFL